MKILSPFGLALALPLVAVQGCATPVEFSGCDATEISANCDVIYAVASEFEGDASVNGQGGTPSGGTGGSGNPAQGGSGNPAQGGSGNPAQGGSGNPAQGGTGNAGNGGTGQGGTAQAGGAGEGGAAGSGTGGTASGGTGGTGSGTPVFSNASCDFAVQTGCENLGCQNCGANDTYCQQQCPLVVACAEDNIACLSAADPLCGRRDGNAEQACTDLVEMSGNLNPSVGSATSFARPLVECLCSRP